MRTLLHRLARRTVVTLIAAFGVTTTAAGADWLTWFSTNEPDTPAVLPAAKFEPLTQNYSFTEDASAAVRANEPLPPPTPPQSTPPPSSATGRISDGYTPGQFDQPPDSQPYNDEPYAESQILNPAGCCRPPTVVEDACGARAFQYPDNWMWGCGGSPYRTGPGLCDDWKVGCRWETSVDGLMLFREDANLNALQESVAPVFDNPIVRDQFDWGPGGRVSFVGKYPKWMGFQVQAAYEGVEEWNASLVAPKVILDVPTQLSQQESLFDRSSLHSAELNILQRCNAATQTFCGIRYIKFDDEINYSIVQEVLPPLPVMGGASTSATSQYMINDLENNLIGFQIGGRHDLWHPVRRFTLEGFINAGVYYNHIKRTDQMTVTTTQYVADDTTTLDDDETRTNVVSTTNSVVSEPSEVATVCEASLTGVCRLNKCWAMRAGYQVLWIDGVALAEDAFLGRDIETRSLLFHGLHMGIECRR